MGLVLVLLWGAAAIAWSLFSRRQQTIAIPAGELLPPEVNRRTTRFAYSEQKHGKTVFHVEAEISTETEGGMHTLRNVSLTRYDETGKPSETISGAEAVYEIDKKHIQFAGNVQIQLADATRIHSQQVRADLNQEQVFVDQNFQFERGQVRGKGESLVYHIPTRELLVKGRFELALPSPPTSLRARARGARYRVLEGRIDLEGETEISDSGGSLSADRMEVFLTENKQILKILSSGNARLRSQDRQTFRGSQINIFLEPRLKKAQSFEVIGAPRAVYEETVTEGVHYLEAAQITGIVDQAWLKAFSAKEKVLFRSSAFQLDELRADSLEGSFFAQDRSFETLQVAGSVTAVRNISSGGRKRTERLSSDSLRLDFQPAQKLERVLALGKVHAESESEQEFRRLFAGASVELHYAEGGLQSVLAQDDCVLETRDSTGQRILRAPSIRARYESGVLQQATADGGTSLEFREQEKARYTTAERLDLFYRKGKLHEAVQSGQFHFQDRQSSSPIDLKAEGAVYSVERDEVTVTGNKRPVLEHSSSETRAERFIIDRKTGKISAYGNVQTLLREEKMLIAAGKMEADPESGWIQYQDRPRLLQRENWMAGKRIRFNNQEQQLIVEEGVESFLVQEDTQARKNFWISADRLLYQRARQTARYQGRVEVRGSGFVVQAPAVDLRFGEGDPGELQEVVALGPVRVFQQERRGEGERAVYFPDQDVIVLTGNPAQVVEAKRGKSSGPQLTFHIRENRMLVEAPSASAKKP